MNSCNQSHRSLTAGCWDGVMIPLLDGTKVSVPPRASLKMAREWFANCVEIAEQWKSPWRRAKEIKEEGDDRYRHNGGDWTAETGSYMCPHDSNPKETVPFSPDHIIPSERKRRLGDSVTLTMLQPPKRNRYCFLSSLLKTSHPVKSFSPSRTDSSLVFAFMRVGE